MIEGSHSRWLPMQGCVNFRDLGGYRSSRGQTTRWRMLFRSDALQEMTHADSELAIDELNIGLVVDLRNTNEAQRDGLGPLPERGAEYRHYPLLDARGEIPPFTGGDIVERLSETYRWLVQNSGVGIAAAIKSVADALDGGKGVVFHCSAGKGPYRSAGRPDPGSAERGRRDDRGRLHVDWRSGRRDSEPHQGDGE